MANLLANLSKHLQRQQVTQRSTFIRSLSSFNNNRTKSGIISILQSNEDLNVWSESNWTEFGRLINKSIDFPLPGQTGPASHRVSRQQQQQQQQQQLENNDLRTANNNSIGYLGYSATSSVTEKTPQSLLRLRQASGGVYFDAQAFLDSNNNSNTTTTTTTTTTRATTAATGETTLVENNNNTKMETQKADFELRAYPCPVSLLKDFENYFRSRLDDGLSSSTRSSQQQQSTTTTTSPASLNDSGLTLITVSFKSEQDMATWSVDVENERERLIDEFVDTAQGLCSVLEKAGYWADFIDPSSGRPFKSPYSHATFWETDERYQQLGFEILDHGCCKTIAHHKWGTKTYVGSLITSASVNAEIVQQLQKKLASSSASNENANISTTNLD